MQGLIIAKLPPSNVDQNSEFKAPSSPHFTGNFTCFKSKKQNRSWIYELTCVGSMRLGSSLIITIILY